MQKIETTNQLRKKLLKTDKEYLHKYICKYDIDYWSEHIRRFENPPHIQEWCGLLNQVLFEGLRRLCVIAARDHAKSEVFAINTITYLAKYGVDIGWKWVYVFCDTQDQANDMMARAKASIKECYPGLLNRMIKDDVKEKKLRNEFRFMGRGAGASVRGAHPDLIIGDDILNDQNCETNQGREKVKKWWFGTVTNMAKPTSAIILEGTPQHELDLLMTMKKNPVYLTKVYPAKVEVSDEVVNDYHRSHPQDTGKLIKEKVSIDNEKFIGEKPYKSFDPSGILNIEIKTR